MVFGRLVSVIVGGYFGVVLDQNYSIPKAPSPISLYNKAMEMMNDSSNDSKKKD